MFRPEGVWLDFGDGERQYLAFERSGSMSRQAQLPFIRADLYDAVRRRIQMDMTIRPDQLTLPGGAMLVKDYKGNQLLLFSSQWSIGWTAERNKQLTLAEFGGTKF